MDSLFTEEDLRQPSVFNITEIKKCPGKTIAPLSHWYRYFPCINVNRIKDIPIDYPGPIGVPCGIFDFERIPGCNPARYYIPPSYIFEILDSVKPSINGRSIYQRIVIRNLTPELPPRWFSPVCPFATKCTLNCPRPLNEKDLKAIKSTQQKSQ